MLGSLSLLRQMLPCLQVKRLCLNLIASLLAAAALVHPADARDNAGPTVVCFGDSITKRGYPEVLSQLLGVRTINAGVAGNNTSQGLRRLERDVLVHEADVVVILFGTNDSRVDSDRAYVSVEEYASNLTKIITRCQQRGASVIVGTVPPIVESKYFERHDVRKFEAAGGLSALLDRYRNAAKEVALSLDARVVDLAHRLEQEPTWVSRDGVHPSTDGNGILAKHFGKEVSALLLATGASIPAITSPDAKQADVVIYGATSAGIVAAVQAASMKKSVLLIEPSQHIGGMTTGGLGATDIGNKDVIGGLSREFYRRIAQHYQNDDAWEFETREAFFASRSTRSKIEETEGPNGTMWTFEPRVASTVFKQMMAEAGIAVRCGAKLTQVEKSGARIQSLAFDDGSHVHGKVFIDATYEGDLLAKSGVSYRVGREPNAEFNESLNGIRDKTPKNQLYGSIDPYLVPGDPSSGLLPLIAAGDGGIPGEGDHRVQAYNFRLCFTNVAENRLPLEPPANYDPSRYELAARRIEKIIATGKSPRMNQFCHPVWMPNGKTDINNSQGISTDFIGANYDYPDGDEATRARIWQEHEDYTRGFWHFMSTSPRVPEALRREFSSFGPCRDEFLETNGWPSQLYVREARRMVSDYVMTEHNCRSRVVANDSVGMAAYGMDSHNCQRIVKNGIARNEGDVQVHGLRPYPIAYRSIVPAANECSNLLSPVCVSATHIAYGSIRMEPVFMVLGQSSAVAASLAIDGESTVQEVDYNQLRPVLIAAGQVLQRQKATKP